MDRRTACQTLTALSVLAVLPSRAQTARAARVAWVSIDRANPESPFLIGFRRGMQALGWIEGQGVLIEAWWAGGSADRLKALVPEIVASRPDVIVAAGGPAVQPLIAANVPIPIVFTYSADVVLGKVVQSWARPGVNRTGISFFSLELVPKRLQLMKEVMPGMRRVALVGWPPHAGELVELKAATTAADSLGLQHQYHGANNAAELDAAFDAIARWNADAILAFAGGITAAHPDRFAAFSAQRRIPAVSSWAVFAEKGNLMTYGPVLRESYVRLAWYVDRILKGAKPANLPVELPTKLEFVLNIKVAKSLGIVVPESVLLRADRLIE